MESRVRLFVSTIRVAMFAEPPTVPYVHQGLMSRALLTGSFRGERGLFADCITGLKSSPMIHEYVRLWIPLERDGLGVPRGRESACLQIYGGIFVLRRTRP